MDSNANPALRQVRLALLKGKTWRYLRYLHLRSYVSLIAQDIETVCICGAGHAWAEMALAIEFPHLRIMLTDIIAEGYPNYHRAMEFAWTRNIGNVSFSIWNVLNPTKRRFDLVCSTEMLEHIEDDVRAALNMRSAATRYIYCLVPFADAETNANTEKRKRVLDTHGHHVFGYDAARLRELFGASEHITGAYWAKIGGAFRARLTGLSTVDIETSLPDLILEAEKDLIDRIPTSSAEAQGIKILSKVY